MPAWECRNPVDSEGRLCPRCRALRVLELGPAGAEEQIKAAFQSLVKAWDPDGFKPGLSLKAAAQARLKGINTAYLFPASRAEPLAARSARSSTAVNSRSAVAAKSPMVALIAALHLSFKCLLVLIALLVCRYL